VTFQEELRDSFSDVDSQEERALAEKFFQVCLCVCDAVECTVWQQLAWVRHYSEKACHMA